MFLRGICDFFANNGQVLSSVQGLPESVHRMRVENDETAGGPGTAEKWVVWGTGRCGPGLGKFSAVYGSRVDIASRPWVCLEE